MIRVLISLCKFWVHGSMVLYRFHVIRNRTIRGFYCNKSFCILLHCILNLTYPCHLHISCHHHFIMQAQCIANTFGGHMTNNIIIQCCWNMVARWPNATHESIGRPKVPTLMVRLATNELKILQKIFQNGAGHNIHWYHMRPFVLVPLEVKCKFQPRTERGHPPINHGWFVARLRILHFPQH